MYSAKTELDIFGFYTMEVWNKHGFKESILEEVK